MDPRSSTSRMHRGVIGAAVLVLAVPAMAQTLQEVVVSASREAQRSFDVPASVTVVGAGEIAAAGPRVNLSEVMGRVAGISVLDRQNYAQDLQLTIRGAGVRSTFGIRGVRLVVDGIPATMPDGQGQASTISLPSTGRIEVLRGPLAQLYGNSAGGVVQAFTADAPSRPELRFGLDAGPEDMRRWGLQLAGRSGALDYLVDHSDFATDGWRDHGAARRRHTNARLRWDVTVLRRAGPHARADAGRSAPGGAQRDAVPGR
jgi:iron complex outermembrane receptor protein